MSEQGLAGFGASEILRSGGCRVWGLLGSRCKKKCVAGPAPSRKSDSRLCYFAFGVCSEVFGLSSTQRSIGGHSVCCVQRSPTPKFQLLCLSFLLRVQSQ